MKIFQIEKKDIDSVFEVVEVPLDGAQGFSQLSSGPVELLRTRDRRRCSRAAHRQTAAGRRRDPDILQLAPAAVQAAIFVQRLAHLAETYDKSQAHKPIKISAAGDTYLDEFASINDISTGHVAILKSLYTFII